MTRKYIIVADDSIKGFDEEIAKLEREWGAEEIEPCEDAVQQTRWIPVSEKVPDYGQEVLLFDKNFGYVVGTYEKVDYFGIAEPSFLIHKSIDSLEKASINPIAWMPLPQAYKIESEDV